MKDWVIIADAYKAVVTENKIDSVTTFFLSYYVLAVIVVLNTFLAFIIDMYRAQISNISGFSTGTNDPNSSQDLNNSGMTESRAMENMAGNVNFSTTILASSSGSENKPIPIAPMSSRSYGGLE